MFRDYFIRPIAMLLVSVGLFAVSCSDDDQEKEEPLPPVIPSVSMNKVSVNTTSVTIVLSAVNSDKLAYSYVEKGTQLPSAEQILESGVSANANAPSNYVIDGLTPGTEYTVVAASSNEALVSKVASMDVVTEAVKDAKAGDFYYSDGTWSSGEESPLAGKECIGIVFLTGRGAADNGGVDTGVYKIKDKSTELDEIHGYVVSLNQPKEDFINVQWGPTGVEAMTSIEKNDFEGYFNTCQIIEKAGGKLSSNQEGFPAAYYAVNVYEKTVPAPEQSSGWFLPSAGQLKYIYEHYDAIHASMDKLPKDSYLYVYRRDAIYWSSTEYRDAYDQAWKAYEVNMDEANITPGYVAEQTKSKSYMVRPVLVF